VSWTHLHMLRAGMPHGLSDMHHDGMYGDEHGLEDEDEDDYDEEMPEDDEDEEQVGAHVCACAHSAYT